MKVLFVSFSFKKKKRPEPFGSGRTCKSVVPPDFPPERGTLGPVTAGDRRGISSPRLAGAFRAPVGGLAPSGPSLTRVNERTDPFLRLFTPSIQKGVRFVKGEFWGTGRYGVFYGFSSDS